MESITGVLRRFSALALVLAFTATTTAALGAHACPHHDGIPAAAADEGHAAHDSHGSPETPGHDAPCTCVGACAAPAPVALPAAQALRVAEAAVPAVAPTIESSTAAVPSSVAYLLPFANAPPVR